jgi:hypothetical protein
MESGFIFLGLVKDTEQDSDLTPSKYLKRIKQGAERLQELISFTNSNCNHPTNKYQSKYIPILMCLSIVLSVLPLYPQMVSPTLSRPALFLHC